MEKKWAEGEKISEAKRGGEGKAGNECDRAKERCENQKGPSVPLTLTLEDRGRE